MPMRQLRQNIDLIDDQLLDLLIRRQQLASQLGDVKRELGLPIFDPHRETGILGRLDQRNSDRLSHRAVRAVWREIFSASRQAQTPLRVAYLGPEGTFTHQAALTRFGSSVELIAHQTINAAFSAFENNRMNFAVLPVENTLQGVVGETVDLLGAAGKPFIIDELVIPIQFVFSSLRERLEDIKTIYSKEEAFPQCSNFLNQPALSNASRKAVASTAEAVLCAARDPAGAALSAEIAASQAGVPILFRHVENVAGNKTRFLILGRRQPAPAGGDKTSVFARVPNVAGGLASLLEAFRARCINLTKIESRPMDDAVDFETWFYIELEGRLDSPDGKDLSKDHKLVWLGTYPRFDAQVVAETPEA